MVSPDSSPFSPLLKLMDIQSATDALSGGSVIAVRPPSRSRSPVSPAGADTRA